MNLLKLPERIRDKIMPESNTGCWLWTANLNDKGYPMLVANRKSYRAHRYIYRFFHPELEGELDHLCRTRSCVNPMHLEVTSRSENCRRKLKATHCRKGHPLSGSNVGHPPSGSRYCKICRAEYVKLWHRKNGQKLWQREVVARNIKKRRPDQSQRWALYRKEVMPNE